MWFLQQEFLAKRQHGRASKSSHRRASICLRTMRLQLCQEVGNGPAQSYCTHGWKTLPMCLLPQKLPKTRPDAKARANSHWHKVLQLEKRLKSSLWPRELWYESSFFCLLRPYACQFCHKAFTQRDKMVVHTRLHTGERPYVCEICGKGFCESGNLKKHMRVHGKEPPQIMHQNNKGKPAPNQQNVSTPKKRNASLSLCQHFSLSIHLLNCLGQLYSFGWGCKNCFKNFKRWFSSSFSIIFCSLKRNPVLISFCCSNSNSSSKWPTSRMGATPRVAALSPPIILLHVPRQSILLHLEHRRRLQHLNQAARQTFRRHFTSSCQQSIRISTAHLQPWQQLFITKLDSQTQ